MRIYTKLLIRFSARRISTRVQQPFSSVKAAAAASSARRATVRHRSARRRGPDKPNLRGIVRPLHSFDADAPLSQAMESLIQGHTHIALVREKDGRVAGLITLEDILEEFVGDIRDEYDRLPTYVTRPIGIPAG